ncbi:MAG: hypothetical protein KDC87_08755 [Planctomycetes bacterium]|nr:hypothetical protein [Planctomycetota bacterium]MCB9888751.1 hypothetical protein [Planctomycetota bacterium]
MTGCATRVQTESDPRLAGLRAMGYRIAVMPFAVTAPADGFLASSLAPVGELFALEPGAPRLPDRARIGALLRGDVVAWLRQGAFEVVETWVSDTKLAHSGMSAGELADPKFARRVAAVLKVDGVLYGDVLRWNRAYYVLESRAEVALRLELHDGPTRERLFRTERSESVGSGLSGGPTGLVAAATEPLAALRGSQLRELTRAVGRHAAIDLNGGALRPEPGPLTPRLSVFALARPHPGPFRVGERIDLLAIGTPGCVVRFDLGRLRVGVPMLETSRFEDPRGARATYEGHYVVQEVDPRVRLPVYGTIHPAGSPRAMMTRYRWGGEVEIGPR